MSSYYESEILKELEVGEIYSERDIRGFISSKRDVTILCPNTWQFDSNNRYTKYKVLDMFKTYLHQKVNGNYKINTDEKTVYKILRVN